jgi:nitronate monooxygenase
MGAMNVLDRLAIPIVQAPLAGGPSTPELAAAVSGAGGLGFVAAGYLTPERLAADIAAVRALTDAPFGVNLFAPPAGPADAGAVGAYAERVAGEAARAGVAAGEPRHDDDGFDAKVELLIADPVPVVSLPFGNATPAVFEALHGVGTQVWITVTEVEEAVAAVQAGADALVVQGVEAGGHRGTFADADGRGEVALLALLQLVRAAVGVPLVATGAIMTGAGVAAVLAAGAAAAQLGSAFLLTPEARTSDVHRAALAADGPTALTRAFTGRQARGIVNRFLAEHSGAAPRAYPELHHLTAPLRAHGRATGDGEVVNLWAGQAHALARELPAAELVRELAQEARAALAAASSRFAPKS